MVHLKKTASSAAEKKPPDVKIYPTASEFYQLYEEVGQGASASVYRALCIPFDEIVAIKILDYEHGDTDNIIRESKTMTLVHHPNVLKSHCSFARDQDIWVVMPYMDGGSCLHILKSAFPDGFDEVVIATILREVLKGLEYLHGEGHIHRDVKAGNILIESHGAIKLGDLGVSAFLFDPADRLHTRNTFVGTPCWMAPEVMAQLHGGYDFKKKKCGGNIFSSHRADIWSFGITALELAHGHAPFSKHPPHKVLLMTLQNAPPGLDYERDKRFSKSFRQMIAMCLVKEPSKRPSAQKLLKHPFFKNAKSSEYIVHTLLEGLPALGKRMESLKMKEANLLAQRKMSDGIKEEMSQDEYKRGISGWNFNVYDMKAEASLVHDLEEIIPDTEKKPSECKMGKGDELKNTAVALPLDGLTVNDHNDGRVINEDNLSIAGSSHVQNTSQQQNVSLVENGLTGKFELDIPATIFEDVVFHSLLRTGGSSGTNLQDLTRSQLEDTRDEKRVHVPEIASCNGIIVRHAVGEDSSNFPATNGDDFDKNLEGTFQQRGRFRVSDITDTEKLQPSSMLLESHSVQLEKAQDGKVQELTGMQL